ncbi:MAG TPA: hypothetical protein VF712_18800 [Thermoleophilaceae bacterium]|jgi:hypothetical protein
MGRTRLDCPIQLDGRTARSETLLADAGPYSLCLSTTLPDVAIALHSSYLGHGQAADTHVSHLLLRGGDAEIEARTVPHPELPVAYARRRCLYDHLQRLQDLLEAEGFGPARMDGLDDAALLVEA